MEWVITLLWNGRSLSNRVGDHFALESAENASWVMLRRILEGQQRVSATFRRWDARTLHVRKATRAEAPQQAFYDALGVGSAPGGVRKSFV